ncbi:MAG: hypothetical protein FJ387_29710 [Verrucomicrobia bacterium]|nr:hypothetical protein [Verrucomicrobiota bacterium]
MSKKFPLAGVLAVLMIACLFANMWICYRYVRSLHAAQLKQIEVARLQGMLVMVNRNRAIVTALANDAIEYSKRNPAMETVLQPFAAQLQQLGFRPRQATPPAPATR